MSNCYQREITEDSFRHLINLKELNLSGCNQNWILNNHFTDKLFDYLSGLETLEIDDNYVISDIGLKQLNLGFPHI
jgi:hypothetical protein